MRTILLIDQTVTFATANLFNFVQPPNAYYDFENIYEQDAWQRKCDWTKQQLTELAADVVGLQEVFSIDSARELMNQLGYPYFSTVDKPHIEDEYIFSRPVVALASKYPISQCRAVTPPSKIASIYGVTPPEFSRAPIFAIVEIPNIGQLAVYVCHLKSQRATDSHSSDLSMPAIGKWLSSQQRGWEAAMLAQFMLEEYSKHPIPTLLMGDMNQSLSSDITSSLLGNYQQNHNQFGLYDSWDLVNARDTETWPKRPATHYHYATGNVLDYILLSAEFQPDSPCSMADVIAYRTLDQHLINPKFEQDRQASDHAFIAVTVQFVL